MSKYDPANYGQKCPQCKKRRVRGLEWSVPVKVETWIDESVFEFYVCSRCGNRWKYDRVLR